MPTRKRMAALNMDMATNNRDFLSFSYLILDVLKKMNKHIGI